jgi:hypothetical protein
VREGSAGAVYKRKIARLRAARFQATARRIGKIAEVRKFSKLLQNPQIDLRIQGHHNFRMVATATKYKLQAV